MERVPGVHARNLAAHENLANISLRLPRRNCLGGFPGARHPRHLASCLRLRLCCCGCSAGLSCLGRNSAPPNASNHALRSSALLTAGGVRGVQGRRAWCRRVQSSVWLGGHHARRWRHWTRQASDQCASDHAWAVACSVPKPSTTARRLRLGRFVFQHHPIYQPRCFRRCHGPLALNPAACGGSCRGLRCQKQRTEWHSPPGPPCSTTSLLTMNSKALLCCSVSTPPSACNALHC